MTVRRATPDDFESLVRIQRRAVDVTLRAVYDSSAIDAWILRINVAKFERIEMIGEVLLVCEENESVVGFSSYRVSDSLVGMWYVDPDHQRHGVGRALLVASEDGLRVAGVAVAVTEASVFARPRFESMGWSVKEEIGKPAFGGIFQVSLMTKPLL